MSDRGFWWVEQNEKEFKALVDAFRGAQGTDETSSPCGGVLVITGAGCSASAGIPTAWQLAQECAVDLWRIHGRPWSCDKLRGPLAAQAKSALVNLVKHRILEDCDHLVGQKASEPPWGELYEHLFNKFYGGPVAQKEVIERALACGQGLNWAHACLGELMLKRYVHTVLTVNFDLLAFEGAIRAGVIPVVADGFEALSRVDGVPAAHPQVIYLHGTCQNYRLRNSTKDVNEVYDHPDAIRVVGNLLRDSKCILVVGYSASDDGLARLLQRFEYKNPLFWAAFDSQREKLSAHARAISGSPNAHLLRGVDADGLFKELLREIDLNVPEWIKNPLDGLSQAAKRLLCGGDTEVKAIVKKFRERIARCQILMMDNPDPVGFEVSLLRLARQDLKTVNELRKLRSRNPTSPEVLRALGETLLAVGKREDEYALLVEAVEALRECLRHLPQNIDKKAAWAQTQTMLGRALISLGEWEEGPERLTEAVESFRAALKVHTRKRLAFEWAEDQNNLGTALRSLAGREEGTVHLKEAVDSFRSALKVYTRKEWPDQWAMTQTNLGEALTKLGEQEEGRAYLEEAVTALCQVLEVRTREGLSPAWARTQHYLGNALRSLGNREEGEAGKAHLEDAVGAYRSALKVRTRKWKPIYWARTQDRLGRALASLGNRGEGTSRLEEAVVAYRRALEVRSRKGPIRDRADTLCNLGNALVALGEREEGMARLEEAIVTARAMSELPEPISTAYASCAESVLIRAETSLRARQ